MEGDKIRVNGDVLSWGSITVKIGGEEVKGLTGISYDHKRERTKVYGMGAHHAPRGRTKGKYVPGNPKIKGAKTTMQAIRTLLAKKGGGKSYGDTEFEIVVQAVEDDETPLTVELRRCVYLGLSANHEENPDPLTEEVELDTMGIIENDLTLFDSDTDGSPV